MPELDDRCYYPCNACGHTHHGRTSDYRCPSCSCSDAFRPERVKDDAA